MRATRGAMESSSGILDAKKSAPGDIFRAPQSKQNLPRDYRWGLDGGGVAGGGVVAGWQVAAGGGVAAGAAAGSTLGLMDSNSTSKTSVEPGVMSGPACFEP